MTGLPVGLEAQLRVMPWFEACGEAFAPAGDVGFDIEQVTSWRVAMARCSEDGWEHAIAEAQASVTVHLSERCPAEYVRWNDVSRAAKEVVRRDLRPVLDRTASKHDLPSAFRECVEWDVLHAVMEMSFAVHRPPDFFRRLMTIYAAGHWPCGWKGRWPTGSLIVL